MSLLSSKEVSKPSSVKHPDPSGAQPDVSPSAPDSVLHPEGHALLLRELVPIRLSGDYADTLLPSVSEAQRLLISPSTDSVSPDSSGTASSAPHADVGKPTASYVILCSFNVLRTLLSRGFYDLYYRLTNCLLVFYYRLVFFYVFVATSLLACQGLCSVVSVYTLFRHVRAHVVGYGCRARRVILFFREYMNVSLIREILIRRVLSSKANYFRFRSIAQ